ncbi:MAG TPA: hypothetical protein VNZ25_01770 [Candidatus Angelobacter sp.]|nr:hypothetical protein [Candidatus Angelobacter sp.]
MKIDSICICCYKGDFYMTRILVASIRYWYPEIEISLIKDKSYGDFDTHELEKAWKVKLFPTSRSVFGQGFGKLEPLFLPPGRRFLVLDSDTLFIGPLLEKLEQYEEPFVVQKEEVVSEAWLSHHYFDLKKLASLDPSFVFPGFTFNTGQMVVSSGYLTYADFEPFVSGNPPALLRPDIFKLGEQGLLNYLLMSASNQEKLTLARTSIMLWPPTEEVASLRLDQIVENSPHRSLVHWCGMRKLRLKEMIRGDLLLHFENVYHSQIRGGSLVQTQRRLARLIHHFARLWRTKVRNFVKAKGA